MKSAMKTFQTRVKDFLSYARVFSRNNKSRIVKAWKKAGKIVAMTVME